MSSYSLAHIGVKYYKLQLPL